MEEPEQSRPIRILARRGGQAILEYILLLSIVLGLVTYFLRTMSDRLDSATAVMGGKLEKQLRTGSISVGIWKN